MLHVNTTTGEMTTPPEPGRVLHVIFTPEGIPGHISADPRPGSEPVEGLTIDFLAGHRRTEKGEWVPRDPVVPVPPTPEELAAQAEAEYQAALDAREAAVDAAITASDAYRLFLRGGMTLTAYREAAANIAASFPMPDRG